MFGIRKEPHLDVWTIGAEKPVTHARVPAEIVDQLDEILGAGRGVLKIPAGSTDGVPHFIRYPVRSIAHVSDYTQANYANAYVDLWQGREGELYLQDPDEQGARPLRFSADHEARCEGEPGHCQTFGMDGYNLSEGDVTLDELCYPQPVPVGSMIHIARYHFAGSRGVTAGLIFREAGAEAKRYIGPDDMRRLTVG